MTHALHAVRATKDAKGRGALAVGGLSAVLASTCCVGPLVLLWHRPLIAVATGLLMAAPSWAAVQTVTLSVPSMNCPVCPITVKKALTQVSGVQKAEVDLDKRQATVSLDDAKTSVDVLTKATTNAGYPSTVVR